MKKNISILFTIIFILSFSFFSSAQTDEKSIIIKSNSIEVPNTFDFGNIERGKQVMEMFTIKNKTKNNIDITKLKAPEGYMVSVSKTSLKPESKTTLIIGFDTNWIENKGEFSEQIIIETNLIQDIVLQIKGVYL